MSQPDSQQVFDVGTQKVAAIYGKALWGAAEAAGQTDGVVDELDELVNDLLARYPAFRQILDSALVSHEEKEGILDRTLGGQVSPLLLSFLKVLSVHERLDSLAAIARKVRQLVTDARGQVEVTVTTPVPLASATREELIGKLRQVLGKEPEVTAVTDPTLLGGLVVTVGDTVYDGSLSARLAKTRQEMIDQSVAAIEARRKEFL